MMIRNSIAFMVLLIIAGFCYGGALQDSVLNYIAALNPHIYGRAVYDARAMLGINYDDFSSGNPNRETEFISTISSATGIVYPNPAKTELIIDLTNENSFVQFEIYSVVGIKVFENTLKGKQMNLINIGELANGTYYYLLRDGPVLSTGRFVILK